MICLLKHVATFCFCFQFISVPRTMAMMTMARLTFRMVLTILERIWRIFLVFQHGFQNPLLMNLLYELCTLSNFASKILKGFLFFNKINIGFLINCRKQWEKVNLLLMWSICRPWLSAFACLAKLQLLVLWSGILSVYDTPFCWYNLHSSSLQ